MLHNKLLIYLALIFLTFACSLSGRIAPTDTQEPTPQDTLAPSPTTVPTTIPTVSPVAAEVSSVDGMVLVYVPEGEFLMGSDDDNPQAGDEEKPQHTVYLDAFWIDQTEVTNAMYALCEEDGACEPPLSDKSYTHNPYYGNQSYADNPVDYVNWHQAMAYCTWAGRRLPTEAEWEKAARGTDGSEYPWGDAQPDWNLLNFNYLWEDTDIVGSFPSGASPYGVLDMAGNVSEWVMDWFDADYYSTSPERNPSGPASGSERVVRGGSWNEPGPYSRSALRYGVTMENGNPTLGFRCVRSP